MSETNTAPKTPLWKQLLGALAGATVAFVIDKGYTFTSDHLTAMTGIPARFSQPTGTAESQAFSSSSMEPPASSTSSTPDVSSVAGSTSSARVILGPFGTVRGLKKFFQFGASSSAAAVAVISASSSSSSVSSEMVTIVPVAAARFAMPKATLGFVNETIQPTAMPVPEHRMRQPETLAARVTVEQPNQAENAAGTSASSEYPYGEQTDTATDVSSPDIPVPTWISSEAPMPIEPIPSLPEPTPTEVSPWETVATHTQKKLPQSGFGLDVLAITALGAVIGRRKVKSKKFIG